MNDASAWFHQIADWIVAALGTLFMAVIVFFKKRFNSHGSRIYKIERTYVSRMELDNAMDDVREDLQYIRERIDRLMER